MATPGDSNSDQWTWMAMELPLSEREKELRDLFVNELLVDESDPIAAAQRCGFQQAFAKDYALKFLGEAYVRRRIQEVKHQKVDPILVNQYDKRTIRAVLRREMQNQYGTPAARVAAAAKLSDLIEKDEEKAKASTNRSLRGGVLVIPGIAKVGDWEEVAMASQAKLVADVRN